MNHINPKKKVDYKFVKVTPSIERFKSKLKEHNSKIEKFLKTHIEDYPVDIIIVSFLHISKCLMEGLKEVVIIENSMTELQAEASCEQAIENLFEVMNIVLKMANSIDSIEGE